MSRPPLQTFFVIIVMSVAANHQGAYCDCASQGWQPLFKPSQILHSEFPEHQHSSSTGGPKPTKIRHFKLVPHIVVPLVNPLAYTIHHDNDNHINSDEKLKYTKTKGNFDKHKEVHYHYNLPDPNDSTTKFNDAPPTPTPTPSDPTYLNNNNYPEEESGNEQNVNEHEEGGHNIHNSYDDNLHHSQEDEGHYYSNNPTGEGPSEHSHETTPNDQHYSQEEQPTYNPYYGSGEHNDAVYDASKLTPDVKPGDYPVYQNTQPDSNKYPVYQNTQPDSKYQVYQNTQPDSNKHFSMNYYHNNEIDGRGKTRGKSIYIPLYRITQPSDMPKKPDVVPFNIPNPEKRRPMILPTHPTAFHTNPPNLPLFHLTHKSPTRATIFKTTPQRIPMPLVHPPFSFYNPWRFLLKHDTRQMVLMRPPAPGLPDTWSTQTGSDSSAQLNIFPSKVKMTGVIYPLKNFHIEKPF